MKKNLIFLIVFLSLPLLFSCNKNIEDTSELYAKSTTRGAIVERSGTLMRSGTDPERMRTQMIDAENRLTSGGGLFGTKGGIELFNNDKKEKSEGGVASIGIPVNPYLWRGVLEIISFIPLASVDPFTGIIITDWYTHIDTPDERCKLNVFIKGAELKTSNLKVNSFCQTLSKSGNWVDQKINKENNAKLENAILNKAKKLKLAHS